MRATGMLGSPLPVQARIVDSGNSLRKQSKTPGFIARHLAFNANTSPGHWTTEMQMFRRQAALFLSPCQAPRATHQYLNRS
jgi:hypothetical protein